MKKLFLVLTAALALGATPAMAEAKSAVDFNVFGVLVNLWSGSFETVLPIVPNMSVKADLAYSPNFFWVSNIGLFSAQVEGRYYLGSVLPKGWPDFVYGQPLKGAFAGAGVGVYSVWYKLDTWEGSYVSPDIFAEVGDKYFFNDHFYAEGFLGWDFVIAGTWKWKQNGTEVASYSGLGSYNVGGARIGVNLGYAF